MLFTVGEALKLRELRSLRVLAGSAGLDRELGFVTVMDAPDIANWLRGKELVITTAFSVKDDPRALPRVIRELADHHSAGIGIKLRRYIDQVSPEALDLADQLRVPVIEIPMELAWIDIINPIMTNILHRQAALLERSERIHKEFVRNVLEGGGLESVVRTLSKVTGRPAFIADVRLDVWSSDCPLDDVRAAWTDLSERLATGTQPLAVGAGAAGAGAAGRAVEGEAENEGESASRLIATTFPAAGRALRTAVLPVAVHGDILGFIVFLPGEGGPTSDDVLALEHAATVTALELMKRKATAEVERRFRSQFVLDLVGGSIESERVLIDRAKALGWQMDRPFGLALVDLDRFEQFVAGKKERDIQALKDSLLREAHAVSTERFPGAICTDRSDSVIVLIPLDPHWTPAQCKAAGLEYATLLQKRLQSHLKALTVSIGLGRSYPRAMDIPRSYAEARQALALGRELYGTGVIVHFDDLGLYRFLTRGADRDELAAFVDKQLGPLLRHDQAHGSHLVETLRAFLSANRSVRQAAAALFLHENTLKYRLQRIRQLTGLDLSSAEVCFNLEVALRMHLLA